MRTVLSNIIRILEIKSPDDDLNHETVMHIRINILAYIPHDSETDNIDDGSDFQRSLHPLNI